MNAGARGRSSTHQAGNDQHITTTTNYYYGPSAAGPEGGAPEQEAETGGGRNWFGGHRKTWITVGGTVAVALIGVLGPQLLSGGPDGSDGSDGSVSASGTGTPSVSPSVTASSAAPGSRAAGVASSASPAAGTVQWQGTLVITQASTGYKDLDPAQPVTADYYGQTNDFTTTILSGVDNYEIDALNGATVSLWEDSSRLPDYADCASTVDAGGAGKQPLKKDGVVCVRTSEGRVGRLKMTAASQDEQALTAVVKFDAVVWNLVE
jgi:hypothetical protein